MRVSYVVAIATLAGVVVACAKGERDGTTANSARTSPSASGAATVQGRAPIGSTVTPSPVPLATRPADGCGWIPAAEVEAMLGRFAEPPRPKESGCLYVLPISPGVAAMRERLAESNRKLGVTPERPWQDTPFGVVLKVGVGAAQGERGVRLMGGALAASLKNERPASAGWDAVRLNGGRLGTLTVTADALTADVPVPRDTLRALTARVRDRITDLPFAASAGGQRSESPDPCTLVTRDEAESVLGKLVVAPYRSANGGPLADPAGASCAYYTAKHHVLVVTPLRSGARKALATTRVVGGALDAMVSDTEAAAADTIEGSWDETAMSRDGRLLLRKDDRAVELQYETSSTDKAGALKLGGIAIGRLASGR